MNMKKLLAILLVLSNLIYDGHAQSLSDEMIKLSKIYRNFHFSNDPPKDAFDQLNAITNAELHHAKEFIGELIRTNNNIATTPYLTRPDSLTLKHLFTIRSINFNLHEADPIDNFYLIDSLNTYPASTYEQLSCYYKMLFTAIGNKNRPLNMSSVNFDLNSYGLKDDTEKGIFFLAGMETFGAMIWGYMNIPKPPKYKEALATIQNYPTFNGQPYYQFQDLNFPDFNITTDKRRSKESFKKYHINKYLNTLLYHTVCLGQKKKLKKEQQDVMLGSIMRNESYYKYSENPDIFRSIFQKVSN